jgi:non-heme chloroperoxidase
MNSKSLQLANGITLEYVEQGAAAGTPLVCLHGYTDSLHSFSTVFPHLPPTIQSVAVSLRGHGRSDRPPGGYRPADMAADISLFLEHRGIEAAIILGHSLGATVAQRFALDFPRKTKALILVASFAAYPGNATIDEMRAPVGALTDPVDPAFAEAFQRSTLARPVDEPFLQKAVSETLLLPARVWKAVFEGMASEDYTKELPRLHLPAWLLWGSEDRIVTRNDQHRLLESLAGAQLVVFEGVGHAVHWEVPQRFAREVVAIVEKVRLGGALNQ